MQDWNYNKEWKLDDCTQAFINARRNNRRKKIMKFCEKLKKSFKKESYTDESVYKFKLSILIANIVLCCIECVLVFLW